MAKINLNSILAETKNAVERIEETVEVAQQPLPNFDAILMEWSWRCEKGYPDFNNKKDILALKEVLKEMNLPIPDSLITEAEPVNDPTLADDLESSEFYKNLSAEQKKLLPLFIIDIPLGQLANSVTKLLVSLKGAEAKKYAKAFKSIVDIKSLTTSAVTNNYTNWKPLWDLNIGGAMGRGELYIAFMVKDAVAQGSSQSFDIETSQGKYEVKSLDSYNTEGKRNIGMIRPGAEGKISAHPYFTKPLLDLVGCITDLKNPKIKNDLEDLSKTSEELKKVLAIVEKTSVVTPEKGIPIINKPGDIARSVMSGLYEACLELKKINIDLLLNKDIPRSRITIKGNNNQATYWITQDDVDDIARVAGKDKDASIKVGSLVTDESTNVVILITNLFQNEFVQDPNKFTDGLSRIKKSFFGGKAGLIYFLKGDVKVSDDMSDFATIESSQDGYKFDLKDKNKNLKHIEAQS
jgi:hypothetical protein